MKNLLIFMFGTAFGSVGTLFYLRKGIKKQLEIIENNAKNEKKEADSGSDDDKKEGKNESENASIPFEMKEEGTPVALRESTKINYNRIIEDNYSGKPPVPVMPREDVFAGDDETDGGCFEIDEEDFMRDDTTEKERLVYYRGDKIMATESGTIITNPAILVGTTWENCVGNYAERTAFIRNSKLVTDYEIYVEDGLYTDEYGDENNYRED
jgi:hypothetical protein